MSVASNPYETAKLVDEYLLFHYGSASDTLPYPDGPQGALGFARRSVTEMVDAERRRARALDLGCAVGRSAFELSKFCDAVVGVDFSRAFIAVAQRLRRGEEVPFDRLDEGREATRLVASVPAGARPERVEFEVGDACALRADLGSFDLVHAANLLCRLQRPRDFLRRLPELVVPGGELVLATPCTWLAEFTPVDEWPEGSTLEWLAGRLRGAFELEETRDLPFLIREHARKFQWSVALGSRWRRL